MTAVSADDVGYGTDTAGAGPPRWLLFITGVLWVFIAMAILAADPTSAALIGYMMGFVILMAGVMEFVDMFVAPGWKWLHGLLGILFVLTGIACLMAPFQTFGILAIFIGWYLLIKGTMDIVMSVAFRHQMSLWGLGLFVGIAELFIGVWAIGYPGRSAALLIIWVGIGALMRGISEIVLSFSKRGVA